MKSRRPPGEPPRIPGATFVERLGSGGFADVFLYQQELPRRLVAVKVMAQDVAGKDARESFFREADLMAQVSAHPAIVTVHAADLSDDGRPYIMMEYCPKPNLGVRYRRERFSVPEVLSLGVQIGGAVESAHRAGILHRDIKPANILVTSYNRPVLADFGIATSVTAAGGGAGMSVPWSPPEAFASQPRTTAASDVFSLAATLYTLLAGRSPFERPGHSNSSLELTRRIRAGELTPLTRSDIPTELTAIFKVALNPEPQRRFSSALSLTHALQRIEAQLALPVTEPDVFEDVHAAAEPDDEGAATRVRNVVQITDAPAADRSPVAERAESPEPELEPGEIDSGSHSRSAPHPRTRAGWLTAAAITVTALVVGSAALLSNLGQSQQQAQAPTQPSVSVRSGAQAPPAPIGAQAVLDGDQVKFTWVNPAPADGDSYRVRVVTAEGQRMPETVTEPSFTVVADESEICVMVTVVRASRAESSATEVCAP